MKGDITMDNVQELIKEILLDFNKQIKNAQFIPSPGVAGQGAIPGAGGLSPDVLAAMAAQAAGGAMPVGTPAGMPEAMPAGPSPETTPVSESGEAPVMPNEVKNAIKDAVKEALQESSGDKIQQLEQRVANIETLLEQLMSLLSTGTQPTQ